MKIEIEFTSSYEAAITIDGREMTYGHNAKTGCWSFLSGIAPEEYDSTIGGLVIGKLTSPLVDILQAWMPEEESPDGDCWETWEKLTYSAAEEISRAL